MSEAIDRVVAQGEAEEARLKAEGRVEQRKEVAELKDAGNAAFTAKDFDKACDLYSEALELDHGANLTARSDAPEHALTGVLFANRAAALLKLERRRRRRRIAGARSSAASAKLLARCALACLAQGGEDKVADAFGCVCEGLMLEPNHAVSRKALQEVRNAPGGRLLRPDGDCLAKLKSRIKRRGDAGLLGYALAYVDVLQRLAPAESAAFAHDASTWSTCLGGRIPEPITAAPAAANSPSMDPTL
ncbi:hypothetical protein JL722_1658 [Aureococcus anophagefferens]|nr:hypothetical protein JL722_1658 [Aureococcus anophagefferens]